MQLVKFRISPAKTPSYLLDILKLKDGERHLPSVFIYATFAQYGEYVAKLKNNNESINLLPDGVQISTFVPPATTEIYVHERT